MLSDGPVSADRCDEEAVDRSFERKFVIGFVDKMPLLFITLTALKTGLTTVIALRSTTPALFNEPVKSVSSVI